ncbi:MAG TPA: NADH-quinone oxidoreductase subunit J [Anaerolineales bacterium]|nr:NADH-quinone oxidoreductase subunit J [Anaerolineales bacterium]
MTIEVVLFSILAVITVGSALGMLLSRSAIYAALYLVLNFCAVAVFYILLSAPFIAMSQVTVYAGAIMVLFLFVIMLLGTELLPKSDVLPWQRPLALGLALLLAAEGAYLLFGRGAAAGAVPQPIETFGTPQGVGRTLFNQYLLPFEITSVLLLVAMVGAIILTRPKKDGP